MKIEEGKRTQRRGGSLETMREGISRKGGKTIKTDEGKRIMERAS
jgi:hypothetical protein